ncbi:uncharacterized protein LODBEIA_P20000 [Lodderomyces beijingensis]|uniref:Uncharacterized protein n=1 Tax=Lodderomyces beijingensis TaxID=1775926 RepID=A0ABP0ZKY4_9ASCO
MLFYNQLATTIIFALLTTLVCGLADQGDGAGAKTSEKTIVWITTTMDGHSTVVSTLYSQSFMDTDSAAINVPSGEVGMGSISGSVGGYRTYDHTTISQAGGGAGAGAGINVHAGGILGIFTTIILALGLI